MSTSADPSKLLCGSGSQILSERTDGIGVIRNGSGSTNAGYAHDGLVAISNGSVSATMDRSLLCEVFEDFVGNFDIPKTGDTTVNTSSPWYVKDTSAAGSPTIGIVGDADNGQLELTMDTQNEVQALTLYWKDEQNIDSDSEPVFIVRLKIAAQLSASSKLLIGFASAQNDTPDSVAQNAWIMLNGADLSLFLESDDATTDTDDKDSGVDILAGTFYEFMISCSALHGASATNVKFFYRSTLGGDWTALTSSGVTFKMLADTALQPYISLVKNSAAAESVVIDYVRCFWKRNAS